jgi:stage V sporulation protein G
MNQEIKSVTPFQNVRITLTNNGPTRALASCQVYDAIFLGGIRVVEGSKGLFVSMPSRKNPKGEYKDIFFPANRLMRDTLQSLILKHYEQAQSQAI